MTSPRTETTDRAEPIEDKDKDKPQGAQLSATQVAAGALAAVSSAVVASFFGLAGTLIGAALASVISTVSAALYSNSLQKTNDTLRRARSQLTGRQAPVEPATAPRTTAEPAAAATPATQVLPAHLDPRRAPARRNRPRWTRVAVYAAAVFVVAMGVITGIELIGQKPVAALVGGTETSQETTIGAITNASSSSPVEEQEDDPSSPSSPTTTAPATETGAPTTGADEESASDEDEGSDSDESGSPTPTRTSEAEPTTGSEPTDSSEQTSSEDDTSPAAEAEPTS
jgi:hypothetical protein